MQKSSFIFSEWKSGSKWVSPLDAASTRAFGFITYTWRRSSKDLNCLATESQTNEWYTWGKFPNLKFDTVQNFLKLILWLSRLLLSVILAFLYTKKTVGFIIQLLRRHVDHSLPKCSKTLLKTPRKSNVVTLDGGDKFVFLGLDGLRKELRDGRHQTIIVHIDGVQPYNNSLYSFWTVLLKVSLKITFTRCINVCWISNHQSFFSC